TMHAALRAAFKKRGGTLRQSRASLRYRDVHTSNFEVYADGNVVDSDFIVLANGAWPIHVSGSKLLVTSDFVYPQKGQILHIDTRSESVERWPSLVGFDPHYIVPFPDNRV